MKFHLLNVVLTFFSVPLSCLLAVSNQLSRPDDYNNMMNEEDFWASLGPAEKAAILSWQVIFPGTKWCGDGNKAANYDDLGTFRETDMCCRAHDHCFDYIKSHETKYNLTNPSRFSRIHCDCDSTFHNCLKSVDHFSAKEIGVIFFSLVGFQCFKEEYPIVSCRKHSLVPHRCISYELDETQPKIYQWFDNPGF